MFFKSALAVATVATVLATSALAECNADTKAEIRGLKDGYSELAKKLRKAVARADGQVLRQLGLDEDAAAALPPLPEKPVLASEFFEEDGTPKVTCSDDGTAGEALTEAKDALAAAETAITTYEADVAARETALVAAEDGAVAGDDGEDVAAASPEPEVPSPGEDEDNTPPDPSADPEEDTAKSDEATPEADADGTDEAESAEAEKEEESAPDVASKEPLPDPDNPNLFRRVISLPEAVLRSEASLDAETEELPTFSVLYVFDESQANGQEWLEVGTSLREDSSGWVKSEEALAWSSMLVMNFSPRGSRSEVLFFKDETALTDLVSSTFYATDAGKIYDQLRAERTALGDDPSHSPSWPSELVAVEPETAVTFDNQPYLLPILDWREEAFDGVDDTVLLKVAAVPSDATNIGTTDQNSFGNSAEESAANSDGIFRVGVTFVMDTTVSMQPFIERTYETVEGFFEAFQQLETAQNVSFGLVGFRDNIDRAPDKLEYSVKVFQPLDLDADPRSILATARQMAATKTPTQGFKEDGYLGVHTALTEMDWSPYDARLIVMVTDASSREGSDPLASLEDTNAERMAELARLNNAAVLVIHLRTPTNQENGDFAIAEDQYRRLTATGDEFTTKYFSFDGQSDVEFSEGLKQTADTIAKAVFAAAAGELVMNPDEDLEPVPDSAPEKLARAVRTEIFRAQLESLADQGNGDAPSFLEGWAADKDLTDPSRQSLEVGVFLTRNQLSSLDKQLDNIVRAYRSGGDDPKAFFENLQVLATEMSTDPDKPIPEGRDVVRTILPDFLENLPYRSQVLRLDEEFWLSLGEANKTEFIENLEAKRKIYKDLDDNTSKWVNFGANDPGLEATPVPLLNLP